MPQALEVSLSTLDSERFGVVVARADDVAAASVSDLLAFCEENGVELVIARCDGLDLAAMRALIGAGMTEVEAQIVYQGPIRPARRRTPIREGTAADREALAELARAGFTEMPSHYHVDSRLPLEVCVDAYVDWTLRGLSGEAADLLLVAEIEGRIDGFMMFSLRDAALTAVLSTVSPAARGRGLYNSFLSAGMGWGSERGAEQIIGVTPHGNIAAQRNLIKTGLRPVGSLVTFHGWRDRLQLEPLSPSRAQYASRRWSPSRD